MSGSKSNKLKGVLLDVKIAVGEWMKMSIPNLPEAKKASDIKDMVAAYKVITDMVGKDRPEDDEVKLENADVNKAAGEIRRALKRGTNVMADIFSGEDDED